jgi:MFS family permease
MQIPGSVRPVVSRPLAAALAFIILISCSTATSSVFVAYRNQWGLTTADIGTVFAAYVGTLLPVLLLFGDFAERYGRRTAIALGLALMTAGIGTLMLAHGLPLLLLGRFLQGIGAGLAGSALIAEFAESYRGTLPSGSAQQVVGAVALFTGPVITAIAYDLGGGVSWSYAPMLVLALGALAAAPTFGAPAARGPAAPAAETPYAASVVRCALRFALPLAFVSFAGLSLYLSLVPAYLAAQLHAANPLIGAGAFVASQLASLVATVRLGRVAPERAGVVAPVVLVAGLALLVAGTATTTWAAIVLATVLVGAGGGLASAAAFSVAGRVARGQRTRVLSRLFIGAYLGYSLPAFATGQIAAHTSLTLAFALVIVLLAAIAAVLPLLRAGAGAPCSETALAAAA